MSKGSLNRGRSPTWSIFSYNNSCFSFLKVNRKTLKALQRTLLFQKANSKMLKEIVRCCFFKKQIVRCCYRQAFIVVGFPLDRRLAPSRFYPNREGQILHCVSFSLCRRLHSWRWVSWLPATRHELLRLTPELILLMTSNLGVKLPST